MRLIIYLIAATTLFPASKSFAQKYTHLSSGKVEGQQSYTLPKTVFVIEIPYSVTVYERVNKFQKYNEAELKILQRKYGVNPEIYAQLENTPTKSVEKLLSDSLKVSVVSARDNSKIFYVSSWPRWNKSQIVKFTYGVDGVISDAESLREDKTFDIFVKGLSGLASIAGAAIRGAEPVATLKKDETVNVNIKELDDILLQMEQKLDGQINFDVYKDIKARYESKYNAAFADYFYKVQKKITTVKVLYTPDASTSTGTDIPFFILNTSGLQFNKKLEPFLWGKELVYEDFETKKIARYATLKFESLPDQQKDKFTERADTDLGFAYNIPLRASMLIKDEASKIMYKEIVKIPQLGIVGNIKIGKQKIIISIDPLSGELKSLALAGNAVSTDQIGNAATALTESIKVLQGEDADTKLDKEVKRLENEKKKRALLLELEGDN